MGSGVCWLWQIPTLDKADQFLVNAISDLMVRMGWPVNIVNLKAVHQMRLNNISGSLPIWPLPAIIIIIVKLIVIIISYQRSRSLTWSPSSTVWPPWSQQSASSQETSTSAPSFQLSTCSSIIIFLRRVYSRAGNLFKWLLPSECVQPAPIYCRYISKHRIFFSGPCVDSFALRNIWIVSSFTHNCYVFTAQFHSELSAR